MSKKPKKRLVAWRCTEDVYKRLQKALAESGETQGSFIQRVIVAECNRRDARASE